MIQEIESMAHLRLRMCTLSLLTLGCSSPELTSVAQTERETTAKSDPPEATVPALPIVEKTRQKGPGLETSVALFLQKQPKGELADSVVAAVGIDEISAQALEEGLQLQRGKVERLRKGQEISGVEWSTTKSGDISLVFVAQGRSDEAENHSALRREAKEADLKTQMSNLVQRLGIAGSCELSIDVSEIVGQVLGSKEVFPVSSSVRVGCSIQGARVRDQDLSFSFDGEGKLKDFFAHWPRFSEHRPGKIAELVSKGDSAAIADYLRKKLPERDLATVESVAVVWTVKEGRLEAAFEVFGMPEAGKAWGDLVTE
jgi:hypothetical protein